MHFNATLLGIAFGQFDVYVPWDMSSQTCVIGAYLYTKCSYDIKEENLAPSAVNSRGSLKVSIYYLLMLKLLTFTRRRREAARPRMVCISLPPWSARMLISSPAIHRRTLALQQMVSGTLSRAWRFTAVSCSTTAASSRMLLGVASPGPMIVFLQTPVHHAGCFP